MSPLGILVRCGDVLREISWWRHQMETFSTILAFCAGNSPVTGAFPVTSDAELWCFLRYAPQYTVEKQWWGWWFETPSRPLWRHCNVHLKLMGLCTDLDNILFEFGQRIMITVDNDYSSPFVWHWHTVKPVYNDHLMGYFSAFWSSSRWPRAT